MTKKLVTKNLVWTRPVKRRGHRLCRPPPGAKDVERWDGRRWVPDDGAPGLAFAGRAEEEYPAGWYTECGDACLGDCPGSAAVHRAADRFGCGNGRNVKPFVRRRKRVSKSGAKA